jgi:hypothetical protein
MRRQRKIVRAVASSKVNVGAVCEGFSTDATVHLHRTSVGVNTHLAKVRAKARLHVGAHGVW